MGKRYRFLGLAAIVVIILVAQYIHSMKAGCQVGSQKTDQYLAMYIKQGLNLPACGRAVPFPGALH